MSDSAPLSALQRLAEQQSEHGQQHQHRGGDLEGALAGEQQHRDAEARADCERRAVRQDRTALADQLPAGGHDPAEVAGQQPDGVGDGDHEQAVADREQGGVGGSTRGRTDVRAPAGPGRITG